MHPSVCVYVVIGFFFNPVYVVEISQDVVEIIEDKMRLINLVSNFDGLTTLLVNFSSNKKVLLLETARGVSPTA